MYRISRIDGNGKRWSVIVESDSPQSAVEHLMYVGIRNWKVLSVIPNYNDYYVDVQNGWRYLVERM